MASPQLISNGFRCEMSHKHPRFKTFTLWPEWSALFKLTNTEASPPSCWLPLDGWGLSVFNEPLDGLTCVSGVGGAVEEARGSGYAQVGHPGSVSVHGGRDGVVVGLLRRGTRHVAARRHAVWVTGITCEEETGSQDHTKVAIREYQHAVRLWPRTN